MKNNLAKRLLLAGTMALSLANCSPKPTIDVKEEPELFDYGSNRFEVKKVAVFKDDLAYGDRRGIYLITDKETGKEYIGISGIGISEVGSHSMGKSTLEDER